MLKEEFTDKNSSFSESFVSAEEATVCASGRIRFGLLNSRVEWFDRNCGKPEPSTKPSPRRIAFVVIWPLDSSGTSPGKFSLLRQAQ
jgi:hypothetical protein